MTSGYRDDDELTGKNVEISYVGEEGFVQFNEEQVQEYLEKAETVR